MPIARETAIVNDNPVQGKYSGRRNRLLTVPQRHRWTRCGRWLPTARSTDIAGRSKHRADTRSEEKRRKKPHGVLADSHNLHTLPAAASSGTQRETQEGEAAAAAAAAQTAPARAGACRGSWVLARHEVIGPSPPTCIPIRGPMPQRPRETPRRTCVFARQAALGDVLL